MNPTKGVRPLDYVLAAGLVGLSVVLALANVEAGPNDADLAHKLDSHSALMIPVFIAAAAPILWRRRSILAAVGVSFAVIAGSVAAFGWVTRCGFALPLSIAMAYSVARFAGNRDNQIIGLVGVLALQIVTLIQDASTGGLGALLLSVPAAAIFYGIGFFVQSRAGKVAAQTAEPVPTFEHVNA
jgi:hypothetical protein